VHADTFIALGLKHEQQRPDRDSYMTVHCEKVCGKYIYKPAPEAHIIDYCLNADCGPNTCIGHGCNFKPVPAASAEWDWSGPYDVLSVMQYGSSLFARPETNWADPVTVNDPRIPLRQGNGVYPTLTDLNRVCNLYHEVCRGVCGDGILSLNNEESCDDGNNVNGDGCSAGCKREYCGDGILQPLLGEVCDDGPLGSATCTPDCKRPCLEECNPDPRFNKCHITTSCIKIEGGSASAGKHYCACQHGFRANNSPAADQSAQIRLPWVGQEGRVFVKPGLECNILCNQWTLGRDGCKEVVQNDVCY
jgi:cysteine-rich repeat protein